jgi:hypothetical protein
VPVIDRHIAAPAHCGGMPVKDWRYKGLEGAPWKKGAFMDRFEYDISVISTGDFQKVVFFCSDKGDCSINELPGDQVQALGEILNGRGRDGWELFFLKFGKDGVLTFWKRRVA